MAFPKSVPIVEVEWIDSASGANTWNILESHADQLKPLPCKSAGYLVRKDREAVSIMQSQSVSGQYTDAMTIPRSCVRKITVLAGKKAARG